MNLMKAIMAGVFLFFPADMAVAATAGGYADAEKHAPAKEINFRGAVLGMSLADFREMSFADLTIEPTAKAFCSSDEETKDLRNGIMFFLDDAEKAAGVTECRYYKRQEAIAGFDMGWEPATISVGTQGFSEG